jgi:hypothetical protein
MSIELRCHFVARCFTRNEPIAPQAVRAFAYGALTARSLLACSAAGSLAGRFRTLLLVGLAATAGRFRTLLCWLRPRPLQAVSGRCRWLSSPPGRAPPGSHVQAVFGRCRWWSSPSVFDVMSVLCAEKGDEFLAYFGLLRLTFGLLRLTSAYFA